MNNKPKRDFSPRKEKKSSEKNFKKTSFKGENKERGERNSGFSKKRNGEASHSKSGFHKKSSESFSSDRDNIQRGKRYGEFKPNKERFSDNDEKRERKSSFIKERKSKFNSKSDLQKKRFNKVKNYRKDKKAELTKEKGYEDEFMKFDWPIRLNRYISNAGICGRREADKLITDGLVSVNGKVVTELGTKVDKRDIVKYKGNKILPEKPVYLLMNKPKNYITTTKDESGRQTVMDLISDEIDVRVYPIGRLDRKTTGVLLLTNDGELAQKLTHPSFEVKKIYEVTLAKNVTQAELEKLADGIELEDGMIHADAISYANTEDKNVIGIEIHSGKNRIVRRMFEHLGHTVEKLDRVSFGPFTKKGVERGKFRFLKNAEIAQLKRAKKKLQ
ncbi:MAG: rRNA pseudouridine synthase [Bacteroidetes bacterium]|nr:rRNA pseudouridine synthase [Bacteroidota bacterium]